MPFSPAGYFQGDGSSYEWQNCVLATCTDLIDRCTVGALRVIAPTLRKLSGVTEHRGVSYLEAVNAVSKATGGRVKLAARYGNSRQEVHDLAVAGIPFGISILASVTRYTPYRTGTFTGGHTVYVNNHNSDGTYKVEDPGTGTGYLNWPADLLYRAAEARGGGLINVLVGRDTEGVTRVGATAGKIRAKPDVKAAIKASIVIGKSYNSTRTLNGGTWHTASGRASTGWYEIRYGTGLAYTVGERLR
jgi:hypothetical protein